MYSEGGTCIFTSSKYYRQAYANALQISQPLGYNFLARISQVHVVRQRSGPLTRRIMFQKPLIKPLSTKKTLLQKLPQHLSVSDSKRKNTYLSSNPLSIINKTSNDICQQLSTKYFPQLSKEKKQLVDFLSCFHNISQDVMFAITDYALSSYFVYYDGSNRKIMSHVQKVMSEELIQYDCKVITSQKFQVQKQQNMKNITHLEFNLQHDVKNKNKIDEYAQKIKQRGRQIDGMHSGLHLFIGDCTAKVSTHEILKEQIQNLKYLQYYVYLLSSGILGNGQNAMIKVRGTIRHKTIDFLFLLKLIFSKVTVIKPAFSNYLSSQKYLICQGYVSENGLEVNKYLGSNFDLLAEHGEQKLLINPQLIFRQQFLADNTKNFNDSLIVKGLKETFEIFLKNSNLQIYPPKGSFIQKLNSFNDQEALADIIKEAEEKVPDEEEIKNQIVQENKGGFKYNRQSNHGSNPTAKVQIQEKQAQIDIFQLLKNTKQQAKPVQNAEQKNKKPKQDQSQQLQGRLLQRYKQQEKIKQERKKQKKQKEKKQKQKQKIQLDPHNYTSHFDYAQG